MACPGGYDDKLEDGVKLAVLHCIKSILWVEAELEATS